MTDCCASKEQNTESNDTEFCPSCNTKGKKLKIITLKSMLKPSVLDSLNPSLTHTFVQRKIVMLSILIQRKNCTLSQK